MALGDARESVLQKIKQQHRNLTRFANEILMIHRKLILLVQ